MRSAEQKPLTAKDAKKNAEFAKNFSAPFAVFFASSAVKGFCLGWRKPFAGLQ